jgi:diaminohydroxyphosphoribosylaminopyrimidine deaminase/5-amino-6-(5-phosphoribosylamino)uracil reductase
MRLALGQARRAEGLAFPNPPVGAVVYRGDRILGRGYTRPAGGAHAEIVALESARRRHGRASLRGASLAVTLEPCCHQGRTPPCTTAVAEAGISRVVVGHPDPSRQVGGRGLRRLRARGLRVEVGVLEEACRYQHRGFLSCVERGRPWVALKLAASLDGRIATSRGESRWITGERSRAWVHALRARADAVMVGSGTVRADDPELTARREGRVVRRPIRVRSPAVSR